MSDEVALAQGEAVVVASRKPRLWELHPAEELDIHPLVDGEALAELHAVLAGHSDDAAEHGAHGDGEQGAARMYVECGADVDGGAHVRDGEALGEGDDVALEGEAGAEEAVGPAPLERDGAGAAVDVHAGGEARDAQGVHALAQLEREPGDRTAVHHARQPRARAGPRGRRRRRQVLVGDGRLRRCRRARGALRPRAPLPRRQERRRG